MRRVALVLGAAFLVLLIAPAGATKGNHYPPGCLRQADVNVGYYPMLVSSPTQMHVRPDEASKVITDLELGQRFGVQSVTNPSLLSDPGVPQPVDGWVWGYAKRGGRSGWVPEGTVLPDPEPDGWADGPNHEDFEAAFAFPDEPVRPRFTLGHRVVGTMTVNASTAYLRWAPASSAQWILIRDEPVALLWRSGGSVCVTADGRTGWIAVGLLAP